MINLACISGGCLVLSCIIWTVRIKRIDKKEQKLQTPMEDEAAQAIAQ